MVFRVLADTLIGIELFGELSIKDRSWIADYCKGRQYLSHQQIFSQKDPSRDVYFVINGLVRVTYYSRTGKEIPFRNQTAGEMFGELSAIDSQPLSAHVMTLSDVTLISLNPDDFRSILKKYPNLAYKVMQHLTNLVRLLSERVVEFSTLGVNNRIHAELLRLSFKGELSNE